MDFAELLGHLKNSQKMEHPPFGFTRAAWYGCKLEDFPHDGEHHVVVTLERTMFQYLGNPCEPIRSRWVFIRHERVRSWFRRGVRMKRNSWAPHAADLLAADWVLVKLPKRIEL